VNQKPIIEPNGYKANDYLCGLGGISLAMFLAGFTLGSVLNHWDLAIDTHEVNFPGVATFRADVRAQHADAMGLADWVHMSPDCRHHSRAKGGKPVDPSVRALAEEVPRYGLASNAKVITIENVPEFVEWGPEEEVLDENGQPCYALNKQTGKMEPLMRAIKSRKGEYYDRWVATMRAMGYVNHEHRILNSANYGSAQARRRYIGIFARVGMVITWPPHTHDEHGRGGLPKWRGAIEILEPGNYGKSVFDNSYVENTLNRMAEGVERYGETMAPWFMKYNSNPPSGKFNPGFSSWVPLHTITGQRTPLVVRPVLLHPYYKSGKCIPIFRPLQTVTCKDRFGVMSAVMSMPTVMTKSKFSVLSGAFPVPGFTFAHQFGNGPKAIGQPLRTLLASRRHQYVGFFHYWGQKGQQSPLGRPLPTIVTNCHTRLLSGIYEVGGAGEKVMDKPGDSPAMLRLKAACRKAGMVDLLARMLTVRESARGQGFPDWYQLLGSETDQRKMIGNAVEVNTGLAVAGEVRRMLDRHRATNRALPPLKIRPVVRWEQSDVFAQLFEKQAA
jgi:DNA (cytosine-5)-methyltransferase 1